MLKRPYSIDSYLNHVALKLHEDHSFDVIRIWFLSYDKKAIVLKKFFFKGQEVFKVDKRRLLLERYPCIARVLDSFEVQVHKCSDCSPICNKNNCNVYLNKKEVDEWIEVPLVDTISRELFGVICLIDSSRCRPISRQLVNIITIETNQYSHELTNIVVKEEYKEIASITEKLLEFERNFLLTLKEVKPNQTWTVLSAFDKAISLLNKVTQAEIIIIWRIQSQKLVIKRYQANFDIDDLVIDLNISENRQIPFVEKIVKKEEADFVGKIKDQKIVNALSNIGLNEKHIDEILTISSWSLKHIWVNNKRKYYLLVGSSNFDFFFEKNKIAIQNFVSKFSLIATTENIINSLKNRIRKDNKKLEKQRDVIERRMRANLKSDLARLVLHDFSTYIDTAAFAIEEIEETIHKERAFGTKNKLIDRVTESKNSINEMINLLEQYGNRKFTSVEKGLISISEVLKDACDLCESRASRWGIQIKKKIYGNNCKIFCSRTDLNIILINIIQNSIDAIIENRLSKKRIIDIRSYSDNEMYKILISDSGVGIPNKIISKILEPDFSTKLSRGGTGIGLFSANRMISEIGGKIRVKSTAVNKGTTFEIIFNI